jgi:pimeloyl-ACP methyl ester carboxylesterase
VSAFGISTLIFSAGQEDERATIHVIFGACSPPLINIYKEIRFNMNRRCLSLLLGLFLAASTMTPRGGAQQGIQFEMPQDGPKKQVAKNVPTVPAALEVFNGQSAKISSLADGDTVKLKATLQSPTDLACVAYFKFADDDRKESRVGSCIIAAGAQSCETKLAPALGWYWGKDGKGLTERELRAESGDYGVLKFSAAEKLRVSARPVVLVHGLASNAAAWAEYTKPDGYLASIGLRGFAVGDGQAEGSMSLGDPSQPQKQTKTIAQNAEELARYITGVKRATGAQTVDLVAHGMGGLISRYYIDRLMGDRDVAQLIMLGSPHGGTGCASLPAALGLYLPATLELRPAYLSEVFNRQITRRHGVPFYLLAGNLIIESFKAPCTATPSDILVSRPSVAAVTAPISESPLPHAEMTRSERIFKDFVAPSLQRRAGEFPAESDSKLLASGMAASDKATSSAEPEQFTKVFTGHVNAGGSREVVINLDKLSVASFALYDATRSLALTVRGANGDVIKPTPDTNGLVEVKDPAALFTLGYGFNNPTPGAWKVILRATEQTPGRGADYAFAAKVVGGAMLRARADRMVTMPDQPVTISSSLELAGRPLTGATIQALIRRPDGGTEELGFTGGGEKRAVLVPKESGIYGVDVVARGSTPDGLQIERADFLSFEVQQDPTRGQLALALMVVVGITLLTVAVFWLKNRLGRKANQSW